jgi:flagellar hook-length control protein FliK
VAAKLRAGDAKAAKAKQAGSFEGLPSAPEAAQGDQAAGQPPAPGGLPAAQGKKRTARGRAPAQDSLAEQLAAGAADSRGQVSSAGARQADARGAEVPAAAAARRSPQPHLVVLDLRRGAEQAEARAAAQPAPGQSSNRDSGASQGGVAGGAASREASAGGRAGRAGRAQPGAAQGPFESALERLRAMAGSELVRHSGIVLRDGGGEIRLVLKPESLGSIRIRMNLVDNGIEGRIIVDNAAVKQVLDSSLDALARALTAQGFQTASLEVAVGGQNADGGRAAGEPHPATRQQVAEGFERNVPGIESMSLGDLLVNLFA